MRERLGKDIQKGRSCRKLVWNGTKKEGKPSKGLRKKHRRGKLMIFCWFLEGDTTHLKLR